MEKLKQLDTLIERKKQDRETSQHQQEQNIITDKIYKDNMKEMTKAAEHNKQLEIKKLQQLDLLLQQQD